MAVEPQSNHDLKQFWRSMTPGRMRRTRPFAARRRLATAVLAGVYVIAFVVMFSDLKAGAGLLFSANAMLALIDWNAFVSLGGLAPWMRIGVAARAVVVALLLTGCIALPVVLVRGVLGSRQGTHQQAIAR